MLGSSLCPHTEFLERGVPSSGLYRVYFGEGQTLRRKALLPSSGSKNERSKKRQKQADLKRVRIWWGEGASVFENKFLKENFEASNDELRGKLRTDLSLSLSDDNNRFPTTSFSSFLISSFELAACFFRLLTWRTFRPQRWTRFFPPKRRAREPQIQRILNEISVCWI